MLSAKPWKTDAVIRLFLSVIICTFAGSITLTAAHPAAGNNVSRWFYPLILASLVLLAIALIVLQTPWELESAFRRLALSLACFYGGLICAFFAQNLSGPARHPVDQVIFGGLSFQGATLVLAALFVREHRLRWVEAFGLDDSFGRSILLGVMLTCLFLPLGFLLQYGSVVLLRWAATQLPSFHLEPEAQQVVQTMRTAAHWTQWLPLGVVTLALAPAGEEVLFRGILYPWIKRAWSRRVALVGSSVIFGAIHFNLVSFVPLTVLAVLLALVYELTGNLLAPITAHAVFNAVNLAALYRQGLTP
jgi:uncharacterized protein